MTAIDRREALWLGAGMASLFALPGSAATFPAQMWAEDREGLYFPLQRYIWGLDTLDSAEMLAAFAPRATVRDIDGKQWLPRSGGVADFVRKKVEGPAGGQHHLQINRVSAAGSRYRVESYWSRVEWRVGEPAPVLTALGTFVDTLVKHRGAWLIADRRIALWNSDTVKVPVVQEPAA